MNDKVVIPSVIQVETVAGICNYACIMCPIDQSPRTEIMDNDRFTRILLKLVPYLDHQKLLSFCGLGEMLIDKHVHEKIWIAKELGFRGTGIYSNGELLTAEITQRLFNAHLDTLIVSIDGFTAETEAKIRIGSHLEKVVANVERFIALREEHQWKTRLMIRFTKQALNAHEEADFYKFWSSRIKSRHRDTISIYHVHNVGGSACFTDKLSEKVLAEIKSRKLKCPEIYERLDIASDGSLHFCCGDQFGHYHIGNILEDDLVELYNSPHFVAYREAMERGNILDLELCKNCSVAYSIATREIRSITESN